MRFVILALPRTGSSHLTDLLNNQRDVLCNGEVFHARGVYVRWPKAERNRKVLMELRELRSRDPVAFTERIFASNFGRDHVGFKIFDKQNDAALKHLLADTGLFKVILYRRNVLANYSSKILARMSGNWDLKGKKDKASPEQLKVQFDREHFARFHNKYIGFYQRILSHLGSTRQNFHLLHYEEINDRHLFSALVGAIGGETASIKLESRHIRQNPSNIISRFSKPAEVESFLADRGLMHWAYEGDTSLKDMPVDSASTTTRAAAV